MSFRLPHPLLSFAFLAALLLYATRLTAMAGDSDTLWHLWTGKEILRLGHLPLTDSWSLTAHGYPWYNLSWAWDALLSKALEILTLPYLLIAAITLASLTIAITAYGVWRATGHVIALFATLWCSSLLLTHGVSLRPQLISYFCSAILLVLAERQLQSPHILRTLAITALMILWANTHGGVILGLIILGFYAMEAWTETHRPHARHYTLILACAALACFATPYHIHMPAAIARTLGGELIGHIGEWRHLDPRIEIIPTLYILILAGLAFWQRHALRLIDGSLIILAVAMAILSIRHIPLLGILTALPFARALAAACATHPAITARNESYTADMHSAKSRLALFSIAAALWLSFLLPPMQQRVLTMPKEFSGPDMPWQAIAFVQTIFPDARLFNHYNYGGAIISFSQGRIKHFIDGRAETAFPSSVVRDYLTVATMEGNWQSVLSRHKIDAVMLPASDPLAQWFASRDWIWKEAYRDAETVVYGHIHYVPGTPYDMPANH